MTIKCPICGLPATWEENRNRPFCSERCRLIDLGNWASDGYVIEGKTDSDKNPQSPEEDTA